ALMMANFSYFLLIKEKLDHIFQKVMKNMIQFIYWRDLCPGLFLISLNYERGAEHEAIGQVDTVVVGSISDDCSWICWVRLP
ncbi:hypothetical protein, partial [Lentilactobacillus sp. Marseille-Q4993]|uniref:hypothetical protein n=1 Tax=Lentilactobacillus sp. Marseille-Q4993 TaxID=3039492 RepID=UPI0024BC79DD